MRSWLERQVKSCALSSDVDGYLQGRGVKSSTIAELGLATWTPSADPAPDELFRKRYLPCGERMAGRLMTPIWSPRGGLVGVEMRDIVRKDPQQYLLPESGWNPVMIGLRAAMPKLWAGGEAWVVEGLFDLAALQWVVPEKDGVVATIRARLSDAHIELFRRLGTHVNIVYDNDETGRAATAKALRRMTQLGMRCNEVRYLGGKDPGEIWDAGGLPAMRQAFAA